MYIQLKMTHGMENVAKLKAILIDKNVLSREGSVGNLVLCVNKKFPQNMGVGVRRSWKDDFCAGGLLSN
jgi:hypothetical protein